MGHFIITLPTGEKADVRHGKVFRKQLIPIWFTILFSRTRKIQEERMGYIVHLDDTQGGTKEYRLMRSLDGQWIEAPDAGFPLYTEAKLCNAIKKAIEEYEHHRDG